MKESEILEMKFVESMERHRQLSDIKLHLFSEFAQRSNDYFRKEQKLLSSEETKIIYTRVYLIFSDCLEEAFYKIMIEMEAFQLETGIKIEALLRKGK